MSVDKIIEEARKKAQEIIENAKREAETIVNEAEKKWREKAEWERKKILEEATRTASYTLTDARRRANLAINKAKADIIKEVFDRAVETIKNEQYDVKASIRNLLVEALEYVDKPKKVVVKNEHVNIVREILHELGYENLEIEALNDALGGVVVVSETGIIVDNRIETRLEQARSRLIDKIAKLLWG